MITTDTSFDNVDIFVQELQDAVEATRWFQASIEHSGVTRLYPSMVNWPTHVQFSMGSIDPANPAASDFWKVGAALDVQGANCTIDVKGDVVSGIWTKGPWVVRTVATLHGSSERFKNRFTSLTDFGWALR